MTYHCITWMTGDPKGYTDWFPVEDFLQPATGAERIHLVTGPRSGRYHARCRVDVKATSARLDYRPFAAFNERYGMELGVMELRFSGKTRERIVQVRWNGENLMPAAVEVSTKARLPKTLIAQQLGRLGVQVVRPEQVRFREDLERAYGGRCSLSGCPVPAALEGAHLTPFAQSGANRASNGLLLRGDLHTLMDAGQLAFHPATKISYFSPEARVWPEYARFHGKKRLSEPQPGFHSASPSTAALKRLWSAFRACYPT